MLIYTATLIIFLLFLAAISVSIPSMDFRWWRHYNVCKDLKKDSLLNFVIVDT